MKKPVFGLKIRLGKTHIYIRSDDPLCARYVRSALIIFVALLVFVLMYDRNVCGIKDSMTGRVEWNYPVTVAHAGGMIGEHTYTNSKEAILYNYKRGQRTFEVDFSPTSDNVLVGKHGWNNVVQEGVKKGEVPTCKEFISRPIYGKYEPTTFEDICLLMMEYPDMWLITDTKNIDGENVKNDITLIVETARELGKEEILDRVVVQIYTPEMYEVVDDIYQFDNWIFTLYQYWSGDLEKFSDIVEFCRKSEIDTITVSNSRYDPEIIDMTKPYNIKIYVHTVNKIEKAQEYLDEGVCGVYTDSIKPDELRRNEK